MDAQNLLINSLIVFANVDDKLQNESGLVSKEGILKTDFISPPESCILE